MKKIAVSLLALILILSMSVTAFAAGTFLSSPSKNNAQVEEYQFAEGCGAQIIVTPYGERDTLNDASRKLLEEAYNQIANNKNLGDLSKALENFAATSGKDVSTLAVIDLFNIGYEGCDGHAEHEYTVKLKPEVTDNFVAVMQYVDGKWIVVENAKIVGGYLTMSSKYYGPVAIVVDAGTRTGDSFPWIYLVMMAVSAAGLVAVSIFYKKKAF